MADPLCDRGDRMTVMAVVLVLVVQLAALRAADVLGLMDEIGPGRVCVAMSLTCWVGLLIGGAI